MTQRYLDRQAFVRLTKTNRLRAYLWLRSTPVPPRVLARIGQTKDVSTHLQEDITKGHIMKCSLGHYFVTKKGRVALAMRLPGIVLNEQETAP